MSTPPTPTISVRNLSVRFGESEVVKNVSFDVAPAETLAVVGESGSGKSVTSYAIMRLLGRSGVTVSGSVEMGGRNLLDLSEPEMEAVRGGEIGMIFQEPMTSLNPVLKVGFQVKEALRAHKTLSSAEAKEQTLELFDQMRIPDARRRLNDYPHMFSGGMRQRIVIATALACRPSLLIADEPTTALDVTIQAQILELLKDIQRRNGMSVIFVTHDMGVVANIADRVLVMRRGEVLEQGSVEQVFNEPQHAYTKLLIQAVPRLGDMTGSATPRRFGRGAGEAATVPLTAPPSPTVPTSAAPSPRVPTSAAPSPTVPTAAAPSAGVPASSAPSPAVPASAVPVPAAPAEAKPHLGKARPVLEVRNLVTRFAVRGGPLRRHVGNVHAVENVSFSIAPGETLSLVGESGSGKSTTGRTILGLEQAQSGEILLDGYEVRPSTRRGIRELRSSIQMIFQDPFGSLDPRQRIGSAVAEPVISRGLASRAEASRKVDHLLRRVGLDPAVRTRYPHEFSGGQRQRICIARALAVDPRLVIADEAVSALDASVKAQVVDLMIDLQEEFGLAYLFISHDMAVVERISHRIAVMYMGEIVEIGSRADILERPRHAYTRRLLDAVPVPNPEHRRKRLPAPEGELPSPIRPVGAHRPQTRMVEVAPGHFVLRTLEEIADEPLPQIEPVPSVDDALADEMMRFGRA